MKYFAVTTVCLVLAILTGCETPLRLSGEAGYSKDQGYYGQGSISGEFKLPRKYSK